MSDIESVYGEACLNYIDREIGFVDRTSRGHSYDDQSLGFYARGISENGRHEVDLRNVFISTNMTIWHHDTSKRKVGLILDVCEDGGFIVAILSNDKIENGNYACCGVTTECANSGDYTSSVLTNEWEFDEASYREIPIYGSDCNSIKWNPPDNIPYDDTLEYTPYVDSTEIPEGAYPFSGNFSYNGQDYPYLYNFDLTTDKNTTLVFGVKRTGLFKIWELLRMNPLIGCRGDLYALAFDARSIGRGLMPMSFPTNEALNNYINSYGEECYSHSYVSVPFNLILTSNESEALAYINNGTLPSDAMLFPCDWHDLPSFSVVQPEDVPNSNTPDDNGRDIDPNPPVTPTWTVPMLSNYNWYWLQVAEFSEFIRWFWNDIGAYNDFTDIIAKIEGLYNDVASSVLMCRYYPVEYEWITGVPISNAPTDAIKLGMITKANSSVQTLDQTHAPHVRELGHLKINDKYKSFLDLAPYSQLSLYLPFHGFMDLDIDIFNGHEIWIKGLYDYLTGTIQYFIYCDNEWLVNTVVAKMAIDIPLTLQTKNDRDSAMFQNVSSVVGGMIGAGVGLASGNPVGMTLGVTQGVSAFNSANASAPLNVRGTVGEQGSMYAPPKCAIILRRPTIQGSNVKNPITSDAGINSGLNTWKHNLGQLCGYGYKLDSLKNKGFTICHTPRIDFDPQTRDEEMPLQSEVDEIYSYLEKGVIL